MLRLRLRIFLRKTKQLRIRINGLETTVHVLQNHITQVDQHISELQSQSTQYQAMVQQVIQQTNQLQAAYTAQEKELTLHSNQIELLTSNIQNVQQQTQEQQANFAVQLAQLNNMVGTQQTQMNDLNARFALLQSTVELLSGTNRLLEQFFQASIGQLVTIQTGAGSVSGIISLSGDDFVQLTEPTGMLVLVPYRSIESWS